MAHSPKFETREEFENPGTPVQEIDYAALAAENAGPYDPEAGSASNKLIACVAGAALLLGVGIYAKNWLGHEVPKIPGLHDLPELVQTHNDYTVQAQAALDKITLPAKVILVQGQGTAHAHLEYSGGFGPRTSWNPFNTNQSADSMYPDAKEQITLPINAITFVAKHKDGEPANQGYYIDAKVDVSKLESQFVGQPVTSTNENWQASAARIFHSVDEGSAGNVTASIASSNYQNSCNPVLTPLIPSGIEAVVYPEVYDLESLAEQHQDDELADWLDQMRTAPMQIEYVEPEADPTNGQAPTAYKTISVGSYQLPKVPADTKDSFAAENKVKASDLKWQVDLSCHESQATKDAITQWSYQNNPNVQIVEPSPGEAALGKE